MQQNLNNPDLNRAGVNRYKPLVLENNWNEDRRDKNFIKEHRPIQTNFDHLYGTTYSAMTSQTFNPGPGLLQFKANLIPIDKVVAFPGHQPDIALVNRIDTYETETRTNYLDPRLKMFPINFNKLMQNN